MDKNIHKISVQDGVALYYVQNDDGTNKYIDIDVENCIVEIRQESGPCLMASIPIKEIKC